MRPFYFLVFLSFIAIFLQSQLSQDLNYKLRGKNRWEGIKKIGRNAPDLELISFTSYREPLSITKETILNVKFYLNERQNLYINVQELNQHKSYWMEAVQTLWPSGWQEFYPWPTGEVINPLKLNLFDLGLRGRLGENFPGTRNIVPLIIYHTKLDSTINQYSMSFRSKENLSQIRYQVSRVANNHTTVKEKLHPPGSGVAFPITFTLDNSNAEYYKVVITFELEQYIGLRSRTYIFFHQPRIW